MEKELFWQEQEYSKEKCYETLLSIAKSVFPEDEKKISDWTIGVIDKYENMGFFKKSANNERKINKYPWMNNCRSSLRFVGMMEESIKYDAMEYKIIIYCCPKYFELNLQSDKFIDIKQIKCRMLQVIRIIERTGHSRDFDFPGKWDAVIFQDSSRDITRCDLEQWIITDYVNNGLYYQNVTEYKKQSIGRIAWGKTIARTVPFIVDDSSFYLEAIREHKYQDYTNWISILHQTIVKRCMNEQQKLGEYTDLHPEYTSVFQDETDISLYADSITSFRRNVFAEREVNLMKAMETYCRGEGKYYRIPRGTVAFQLVWEDVLRRVFTNIKKFKFPAPKYFFRTEDTIAKIDSEKGENRDAMESEADIIYISKDEDGSIYHMLMDAKYYMGRYKGGRVEGLPGYLDIGKQIDYMHTLYRRYNLKNGKNLFLFPQFKQYDNESFNIEVQKSGITCFGYVEKDKNAEDDPVVKKMRELECWDNNGSDNLGEKIDERVYLFQINPDVLYDEFFKNRGVSEKMIRLLRRELCEIVNQ